MKSHGMKRIGIIVLAILFSSVASYAFAADAGTTGSAPLPVYVDNSLLPSFPPIRSQQSGDCAPFSIVYYQLTHEVGLKLGWDNKNEDNSRKFNPRFVYAFIRIPEKGGGTYPSDSYTFLGKHGAAIQTDFPYVGNSLQWCTNPAAWRNAINYRILSSRGFYGLDQIKEYLSQGHILSFSNFSGYKSGRIKDNPATTLDNPFVNETILYGPIYSESIGHQMTIVGYHDELWVDINNNGIVDPGEKGAFKVANSWGTYYSNKGFDWVSYSAISAMEGPTGLNARDVYSPQIVAQFTLNTARRDELYVTLGTSEVSGTVPATTWIPKALYGNQAGNYAFDGTTTAGDGSFVLDFSDIAPTTATAKRFYLTVRDSMADTKPQILKSFKLTDVAGGGRDVNYTLVPKNVDGTTAQAYVDYNYTSNQPPIAMVEATPVSGDSPLDVSFDASQSRDPDGNIAVYQWDFKDGSTATGVKVNHQFTNNSYANDVNYPVTLTVTDNKGGAAGASLVITVNRKTDSTPPAIPVVNDAGDTTASTTSLSASWSSADPDTGIVEYLYCIGTAPGASNTSAWRSAGIQGSVTQTGLSLAIGNIYYFTVKAKNGAGVWSEEGYSNGIRIAGNRPPVLEPIGNKEVRRAELLSFTLHATDPDGDTVKYYASGIPGGATLDSMTGVFKWTPAYNRAGDFKVNFIVKDPKGLSDSELITIHVPNAMPVLEPIPDIAGKKGQLISFTLHATDADGDAIKYYLIKGVSGASLNSTTGVFTWTPKSTQAGVFNLTFAAKDTVGTQDTKTMTITIPNVAPVLAPIENKTVAVGQLLTFNLQATDADNDPLRYYSTKLPSGTYLNTNTGLFKWTPTVTYVGTYTVTFTIKDPNLATDSKTMTIVVQ